MCSETGGGPPRWTSGVFGERPLRRSPAGAWDAFHLHPKDTGGLLISLGVCDPREELPFVDTDWRTVPGASDYTCVTGMHLEESPEPEQVAARWDPLHGHPADEGGARLGATAVTFSGPEANARLAMLEVGCREPAQARTFDLEPVRFHREHTAVSETPTVCRRAADIWTSSWRSRGGSVTSGWSTRVVLTPALRR